jgi:hypothetical protein
MAAVRLAPRPFSKVLPAFAFTWLGLAFMLFCAVLALDLARAAAQGGGWLADLLRTRPGPPADPERRRFIARALAGTALVATGGTGALAFGSARGPAEISEVPVRLARLPRALSGLTIAQITDLHVGPTIGEREVRRVVEQVNALRPDLVAVTGDLVDGSVRDLGRAVAQLGRLEARHGVFFVTGNHEYYSGADEWCTEVARLGLVVLNNAHRVVTRGSASMIVAGVTDYRADRHDAHHKTDPDAALSGAPPADLKVLLAHQPRSIEGASRLGVDLQISGHTHAGQFFPWSLFVGLAQPVTAGLHLWDRTWIYVSRGTGYWGPPNRAGVPSEITLLTLRRA